MSCCASPRVVRRQYPGREHLARLQPARHAVDGQHGRAPAAARAPPHPFQQAQTGRADCAVVAAPHATCAPCDARVSPARVLVGSPNSGGSQFFINVAANTNLDWFSPGPSRHPVRGERRGPMRPIERPRSPRKPPPLHTQATFQRAARPLGVCEDHFGARRGHQDLEGGDGQRQPGRPDQVRAAPTPRIATRSRRWTHACAACVAAG
eukprot:1922087-Prymnesium_polylepis.1